MDKNRLPTALLVEACLKRLEIAAVPCYYIQKGNYDSGLIMLKLNGLKGKVLLLYQERNFDNGELEWRHPDEHAKIDEYEADQYIQRAVSRDPDLWVIEIEDPEMQNPFEE